MKLTITDQDVEQAVALGDESLCNTCPIALVLEAATGHPWYVWDSGMIEPKVTGGFRAKQIRLPIEARLWMKQFDKWAFPGIMQPPGPKPITPFTFTIEEL